MAIRFNANLSDIVKFIWIGLIVAFVWFNYGKISALLDRPSPDAELITRIEKIETGLVKVTGQANTDDLKKLIAELKVDNSKALAAINAANKKVDEVTTIVAKLKGESAIQPGTTYKDPEPTKTFVDTVVTRKDSAGEDLPMARVFFHPEIKEEPWTVQNFPLELHTNVIETQTKEGTYEKYIETYFTNDFVTTSKGKKYYFDTDVHWAKREVNDKSFMWNLRLGISGNASTDTVFPGLDISLASYGKTKRDMDWRFLTLGVGYDSNSVFGYFKPFEYNIGNFVPLIQNMFIGPFAGISSEGETVYGAGISVLF